MADDSKCQTEYFNNIGPWLQYPDVTENTPELWVERREDNSGPDSLLVLKATKEFPDWISVQPSSKHPRNIAVLGRVADEEEDDDEDYDGVGWVIPFLAHRGCKYARVEIFLSDLGTDARTAEEVSKDDG